MNKPLYLFVGQSGSGKTTIANLLEEKHNYIQVKSYTTRPPRYENEPGHIFISKEEFDKLQNLAGYTNYNGNEYCTTCEQLDECDIYVIDPAGVEVLLNKYRKNREIHIIYFNASICIRIDRMIDRHDCDSAIIGRIYNDEKFDWHKSLDDMVERSERDNVILDVVNTNSDISTVLNKILNCMTRDRYS